LLSKLNSWPKNAASCRAVAAVSVLGLSLVAAPVCAGKYAYGEQFVRVGQQWADGGPVPLRSTTGSDTAADNGEYQRQVADLEHRDGPYSDALAEPLAGLGRHYRHTGDLEQALRMYRRALHVVRVNDGLYSERQMPILRDLLEAYRASGDIQALDDRYDYYFRLYGNGQPPYTEVRLRAALAYLRWQREAVRLEIDDDESRRILALYQLNESLLEAVAANSSLAPNWYRELVLSQLRNLYLLEDRFAPTVEQQGMAAATPLLADEWRQEDFNKKRLENMQRGSLSYGTALLQELISRTAGVGDPKELASVYLELGDWYQWHGNDRRAGEQYEQVVQILSQADRQDLLQQWLGQPVELPDNGAFWQSRPNDEPESRTVVKVRYDVSAKGRARNLQAVVSDSGSGGKVARLKRKLSQIRFRPRWISGVAEPASQIQRDYELLN